MSELILAIFILLICSSFWAPRLYEPLAFENFWNAKTIYLVNTIVKQVSRVTITEIKQSETSPDITICNTTPDSEGWHYPYFCPGDYINKANKHKAFWNKWAAERYLRRFI